MTRAAWGRLLASGGIVAGLICGAGAGTAAAADPGGSFPGCPQLSESHSSGPCVQQLQNDLNTVNSGYHLDPDGKFGPDTRIAVLDFQGRNHLGADGTVGATTATELSKQARDQGSVAIPHLQPEPRIGYGIDPAECEAQGPDFKSQPNGWCGWGPHCAKPGDGLVSDGEGHCVPDEAKPLGKSLPDCAREIFGDKAKDAIEKAATDGPEAVAEEFGKKNGVIAGAKAAKCLLLDKPDK